MSKGKGLPRGHVVPSCTRKTIARVVKSSLVAFIEFSFRPNNAFTGRAIAVLKDGKQAVVEVKNGIVQRVIG